MLVFCIILCFLAQVRGIPLSLSSLSLPLPIDIPTLVSRSTLTNLTATALCDCSNSQLQRSLFDIIRSCLLTIAACVYRAIHQNVPDPDASWWKRQRIRVKITFYALIAPEAVIWWAMRQYFGAQQVAEQVNQIYPDLKWTRTHGHFAQMGAFGRKDTNQILFPPTLIELLRNGSIHPDSLRLTQKQVEDRSKGDTLSKLLVASQTSWFVIECMARWYMKLPLTEVEVVTLAFAVLNVFTYAFWWGKPLDVQCPIYVEVKSSGVTHAEAKGELDSNMNLTVPQVVIISIEGAHEEQKPVKETTTASTGATQTHTQTLRKEISDHGFWRTLTNRLIVRPFIALAWPLAELFGDGDVHESAKHISTFYGMKLPDGKGRVVVSLSCLVGVIFGIIHFLSWNSEFPVRMELLLWRGSSAILVTVPVLLTLSVVLSAIHDTAKEGTVLKIVAGLLFDFFGLFSTILGPVAYILARVCLLTLAGLALRSDNPSSDVFQTVAWTSYIPHL
ncbi:hypothetical protein BDN72DRAFT_805965 [Pluteus cervinus]|uniref:Uncharacterized protein n=1 Tax=Pluteus cervinus TaxID=181527 RepID=A0ACD3A2H1_9AGAR|nr:hypothetical protein BDN72DRAFT_805965 [Pluteus cervinus]